MRKTLATLFGILLLSLSSLGMGCTSVQIRQTLKDYNIIVKPGSNIRPRALEEGDGTVKYMETQPGQGDTLMIIVRGKL